MPSLRDAPYNRHHHPSNHQGPQGDDARRITPDESYPQPETCSSRAISGRVSLETKKPSGLAGWRRDKGIRERRHTETARGKPPARGPRTGQPLPRQNTTSLDPAGTYVPQAYDAGFLLALAVQKNGSANREGLAAALREVASAPGEKILPGEWTKAVELIKAGTDIDYEGAGGALDFDEAGDVDGIIVELAVEGGAFVEKGLIQ